MFLSMFGVAGALSHAQGILIIREFSESKRPIKRLEVGTSSLP
jgi:hypothetical protein